jgi:hypothetical protein
LYKYIVSIEGNDSNKKHFVENIEVEAENEDEAKIKANKEFMLPGPQGISSKYDNGTGAVVHWIVGATKQS